jgi:hypothetical protein
MNKKELQEELREVKELYIVGNEAWNCFDVYYVKDGRLIKFWINSEEEDTPGLWIKWHETRKGNMIGGYFRNDVIGSDRTYEIGLSIGRWLFDEPYRFKIVNLYFVK